MSAPKVSVIIPAYNGAQFLGEAVRSVLDQSYSSLELIVVDDVSQDDTRQVVQSFEDGRLKFIGHSTNRGSDAARDTGLRAASGEIIAFLDQDDIFHPEKLEVHVAFMGRYPTVGATYNNRFELNHSATTIRDIWCPPREIFLSDLVLGFPIAPSDIVLRREWADKMDLLNGSQSWCGGEIVHFGRLSLASCRFANVNRALNYRRYHSGRITHDLSGGCASEIDAQDKILSDPCCPKEVSALHDLAHSNIYLIWAYRALYQQETALGQSLLQEAARLNPSILMGKPSALVSFFLRCSVDDVSQDHEAILKRLFAQFPPEMTDVAGQLDCSVAHGFAIKGARTSLWVGPEDGRHFFTRAFALGLRLDDGLVTQMSASLLNYRAEFGEDAAQERLAELVSILGQHDRRRDARRIVGNYAVNRAHQSHRAGDGSAVRQFLLRAVLNDRGYILNRGVLSMMLRPGLRAMSGLQK